MESLKSRLEENGGMLAFVDSDLEFLLYCEYSPRPVGLHEVMVDLMTLPHVVRVMCVMRVPQCESHEDLVPVDTWQPRTSIPFTRVLEFGDLKIWNLWRYHGGTARRSQSRRSHVCKPTVHEF